jgi:hypothetical protein
MEIRQTLLDTKGTRISMDSNRNLSQHCLRNAKPKKPNEIPQPGKDPETVPSEEPEPITWPKKEPETTPGKEPLTTPPSAPPEIPERPDGKYVL